MEKNAVKTIDDLNRRIGSLQAKRDALIKKEKEKKERARERWQAVFMKELSKTFEEVFGPDYEEDLSPRVSAGFLSSHVKEIPRPLGKTKAAEVKDGDPPSGEPLGNTSLT